LRNAGRFHGWLAPLAATCLVAGVIAAIVSIGHVMAQTYDEPIHVSTGLEWLQRKQYTMWTETPPLKRNCALSLRRKRIV